MDPISALSVAAAVVAFVEFGWNVAHATYDIRCAAIGQPAEILRLAATSSELSSIASTARDKLKSLGSSFPRQAESFEHLATECAGAEEKLKEALNKLTVNGTTRMMRAGSRLRVGL